MCNCISYNRPDITGTDTQIVMGGVEIDRCIAVQIQAIWDAGIKTGGSCCSHNNKLAAAPSVFVCNAVDVPKCVDVLRNIDQREWQVITWAAQ